MNLIKIYNKKKIHIRFLEETFELLMYKYIATESFYLSFRFPP